MSLFCIDLVSGSSLNAGSLLAGDANWNVKASASDGVTNGTTTFTSATGGFTSALVGHRVNIQSKGVFLISAFVNSTTLTLASTVSAGTTLAFKIGGALDSMNTLTASYGLAAGDYVAMGPATPIRSLGVNGTLTNASRAVPLSANAGTKDIYTNGAWTAGTNVSAGTSNGKGYANDATLTTNASFTAAARIGLFATGSLDLSAYSRLSLWITCGSGCASGLLQIVLYSDAGGTTPICTMTINEALSASSPKPIVLSFGGPLAANVLSVGLVATGSCASRGFTISTIIAATSTGLTYGTIFSASNENIMTASNDGYWPIQRIRSATPDLTIDGWPLATQGSGRGYWGVGGTQALYVREPIRLTATQMTTQLAGTAGNNIVYEGGWDPTSNTQTGETWFDFGDGTAHGVRISVNYVSFNKLYPVRTGRGYYVFGSNGLGTFINGFAAVGCQNEGLAMDTVLSPGIINIFGVTSCNQRGFVTTNGDGGSVLNLQNLKCNNGSGVTTGINGASTGTTLYLANCNNNVGSAGLFTSNATITLGGTFSGNTTGGITINSMGSRILGSATCSSNTGYGIILADSTNTDVVIASLTTSSNSSGAIRIAGKCAVKILNGTLGESTKVSFGTNEPMVGSWVVVQNYGGTAGDTRFFKGAGNIVSDSSTTQSGSGRSWNFQPSSAATSQFPLYTDCAPIAVDNTLTNRTLYTRRDNTSVVSRISALAGYTPGVTVDVDGTAASGSVGSWEQISVSFTASDLYGGAVIRMSVHNNGVGGTNAWFDTSS